VAEGARRVGRDEVASAVSRGKAAIAARAGVLSEVFVIVSVRLEGEGKGVCVVCVRGESVKPAHHPKAE